MKSVLRTINRSSRLVGAVSLAALLSTSLPLTALAQEGIVARQQQPTQQPQQNPRPPETPREPRRNLPGPESPQRARERDEQGETGARPAPPTDLERRGIPAPGQSPTNPTNSSTQQPSTGPATTPGTQTDQNLITQPLALSPEVTNERVGVRQDQEQMLTLQDAITLALQNNLDIEVARQSVQMAQYNLFSSRGVYDIVSGASINYRRQTRPVTSIIQGGNESVQDSFLTYNFVTDQLIERTGGSYQIDFNNNRSTTNNRFSTLNPSYNPTITFTFTQPLMRNFKIDNNRRQIQLLKRSLDLSDSQFRQQVIDIINSVQRAYWDLVFAIRNEQIARDSVELTRTQLENNRRMVEAGTLAPIELRSTEAALESRKESVIFALQSITTAENTLKGLLIKDPNDKIWYSKVTPTEEPQFGQPTFNLEEATALALKNRPELEQQRLQVEQNQIDQKFFKNQLKPQVDFVGFYSATGSAGTARTNLDPDSPLPGGSPAVPDRLIGGYFRSLRNLASFDFPIYQFGVNISFPWRNRTAEGNLGRSLAEARQLDARQRQLVQTIQIGVRNALQNVEATRQRFEAARAGRIAAEAQLQGEQEKFRAGLSTNFFVLQRQNELAISRGSEVRALTDYNKALADLQRVTGMTLLNNNVNITALDANGSK